MDYKLKQTFEDFRVEELPSVTDEGVGSYSYLFLEKTGLNTLEAVKAIAKKLGISVKRIGWAGNKDKNALTKQLISVYKAKREQVENLQLQNMELTYFGIGSEEITLGKLLGNKFAIMVRNLDGSDCEKIKRNSVLLNENGIPNYFDEQRFGGINPEAGKLILQGNFREAAEKIFGAGASAEKLKLLHRSQLLLYVHSYQSLLFNKILALYIKNNCRGCHKLRYSRGEFLFPKNEIKNAELPVIGFGTELTGDASRILEEERITARNFVIKQLPDISSEGTVRSTFVNPWGFELGNPENDELNPGMKKVRLNFSLPKGSYATILVKALCR